MRDEEFLGKLNGDEGSPRHAALLITALSWLECRRNQNNGAWLEDVVLITAPRGSCTGKSAANQLGGESAHKFPLSPPRKRVCLF